MTEDWEHPAWKVIMPGKQEYKPFNWQREKIHKHSTKSRSVPRLIGACGRRSGKTTAIIAEVVKELFRERPDISGIRKPPLVYVIAPNYELAMKIWEPIWELFVSENGGLNNLKTSHDKMRKLIDLKNGARVQAKTADDPKSLQGDRVTAAFVDEAHDVSEEAWANFMPALTDSRGVLRAIGIPRGKGRFRSYFHRGETDAEGRFESFAVPSWENPAIDPKEIYAMQDELTEAEYKQHYLAEWSEDDGQVFRGFENLFTSETPLVADSQYLMGLDIGKMHDFTVAYVVDIRTGHFVDMDRFNGVDYTTLGPRIANLYEKYNCQTIHMDASGVGEPVQDMLRQEGCSVSPFKFTNNSKARIIAGMASEIEHERVQFLKGDTQLEKELSLYEGKVLAGGAIRYSAPSGYFDDCVIAAALAIDKLKRRRNTSRNAMRGSYLTFGSGRNTW